MSDQAVDNKVQKALHNMKKTLSNEMNIVPNIDDKYKGGFHKFDVLHGKHPVHNQHFMQHCSEMHDQFVAGTKAEKGDIISDVIEHFSSKGGW